MGCHELALKMGRQLGDLKPRLSDDAADVVAVVLALGGQLQIEEAPIPGGNLHALETQPHGPPCHAVKRVEWRFIGSKLRQKNSGSLDGFHDCSPEIESCCTRSLPSFRCDCSRWRAR